VRGCVWPGQLEGPGPGRLQDDAVPQRHRHNILRAPVQDRPQAWVCCYTEYPGIQLTKQYKVPAIKYSPKEWFQYIEFYFESFFLKFGLAAL
jgi:hypothetical protein